MNYIWLFNKYFRETLPDLFVALIMQDNERLDLFTHESIMCLNPFLLEVRIGGRGINNAQS